MAYNKYLGEGIILSYLPWGESGRVIKILTKDGLRSLVATGVRELNSKMRAEIDILSIVEFEYVEGKEVGRLVGIFPKEKMFFLQSEYLLKNILTIRNGISNVTNFILRVVVGELANENLYENFLQGLKEIQNENNFLYLQEIEIVWLVKLLVSLGYWEAGNIDSFVTENYIYVRNNKKEIIEKINKSIESSQM